MFRQAKNLVFTGGTFIGHQGHGNDVLERLKEAAAPNALFNSKERYDPPHCHPHTRSAILDHLDRRTGGEMQAHLTITWLYGPAGSGKSAILQTSSERWANLGCLLATFFFWKSDNTRNSLDRFVSTICYQIVQVLPRVKPLMARVIQLDPLILTKALPTQIQSLIVEPLQQLYSTGFFDGHRPYVIVVDGLDECLKSSDRRVVLRGIAYMTTTCKAPITFLISSRPEVDINHAFNAQPMQGLWLSCTLNRDYQTDKDIRRFLSDSFRDIKLTHPYSHHIPSDWPAGHDINYLVFKASGQFIFASVVIKYVSASNTLPHRSLEVVLGLRPASWNDLPFAELDAIYNHLLVSHFDYTMALAVLRCVLSGTKDTPVIATLLSIGTEDVELAIGPLAAIVTIHLGSRGNELRLEHMSFTDFLFDKSRSGRFYIGSLEDCELQAARLCISCLNSPQAHFRDAIFCDFTDMVLRRQCLTETWRQLANELRMDKVWPLDDAMHFYMYDNYINSEHIPFNPIFDSWVEQIISQLRMQFKRYLSSLNLTAVLVIATATPYQSFEWRFYIPNFTASQRHFDQRAFSVVASQRNLHLYRPSTRMMRKIFNYPTSNRLSLLRRHIDVAVMFLLSSYVRWHFSLRMLHLKSPVNCCQSQYYNGSASKIRPRQWRSRRVYRRAGIMLYRYRTPRDHQYHSNMSEFYNPLPYLLRHCSTSTAMISFVRSHIRYICVSHPSGRHILNVVRLYLSCKKYSRMPHDKVELDGGESCDI